MDHTTGTIILAAGAATRMGFPKQLLEYKGESLVHRITRISLALEAGPVVVVTGAHAQQVTPAIHNLAVTVAHNEDWKTGMGSSIRSGLIHLLEHYPTLSDVLIVLVDQPYVDHQHLQDMLEVYQTEQPLLLVSQYANTTGVPAIFSKPLFTDLLQLKRQKGAKKILQKYREEALPFPFPKGKIDLDTPEDWERFLQQP